MSHATSMIGEVLGAAFLGWYLFILAVCTVGVFHLRHNFSTRPPSPTSTHREPFQVPHVTVLRPIKGLEPYLYACLAATFQQSYPSSKLTIHLCIPSRDDPAYPILETLLQDFPSVDARTFVEEEDPNLTTHYDLGPNPKIRNMSRGYRAAKGDLIWIIDCNVWVPRSACAHMVDRLCGFVPDGQKYKFVHQLPLVVDVTGEDQKASGLANAGSLLEEMFLSTSHAKFYTAISTVAVAPCIVGKSNMFRRSHLDALTTIPGSKHPPGIDFFSSNICEDHLIGDLLWKKPVPPAVLDAAAREGQATNASLQDQGRKTKKWGNHALLPHILAIQPMVHISLSTYISRRTRWLRVRKFTVPLATFVEPGTESLLCSLYGAYGFTTLPFCHTSLHIPQTWTAFWTIWLISVSLWMLVDRHVWSLLQSGATFGGEEGEPAFSRTKERKRRKWRERIWAWAGREVLALWVWTWAVCGGVEVGWRGRRFKVGFDASVREIGGDDEKLRNGHVRKSR